MARYNPTPARIAWAKYASAQTGLFPGTCLVQWNLEQGQDGDHFNQPWNNPGFQTVNSRNQPYDPYGVAGERGFAVYPDTKAGVDGYIWWLNNMSFYQHVRLGDSVRSQLLAMGKSPWDKAHYGGTDTGAADDGGPNAGSSLLARMAGFDPALMMLPIEGSGQAPAPDTGGPTYGPPAPGLGGAAPQPNNGAIVPFMPTIGAFLALFIMFFVAMSVARGGGPV